MAFVRLACLIAATACVLAPARPADAGSLEACAQRVIRDWYSGGRVDRVYPLPCYRAAIRSLPEDVLQYSNADRDIARALAYARQGRSEPEKAPAASGEPAPHQASASARPAPTEKPAVVARPPRPDPVVRRPDQPVRLASGPESETASPSLPYPVIVLGVLAGLLLVTGGAGWLAARRR